jgi:hypothetical protein
MRCPVCRAENDDVTCRRCKADLSLMAAVDDARQQALAQAAHAAAAGHGMTTLQHAEAAHRLRRDAESWRWLAVGALLVRDFALARACHQKACGDQA